ncbi:SDR family NAD(P)-dependent oxidoreductase [Mycobacterium avium]|uniref:SDR family NAD(P)-dependent oxidoreductase n=1 Tax=Mycobacterium avium TaxID=1764 RepID=UPI001CC6F81B|nr:SDR family NAD(P)-dependent oxidoreductase [Mycobacterium avium]MBZ4521867.1 SDR family NAD(P)-dependent oxidoreductase [Mycobacterium avium subsp. hominissuis]MBZ4531250.1 SDR family NAD(P)-dependent oxidoreductase [Mycobacterium avium subsp. hominissuis]
MSTIAIIGAGPGLGLAIARTFGSQGYDVALISRSRDKLDGLIDQLASDGIKAAGFPADVCDRPALTQALNDAAARLGGIDVLEYSPAGTAATTKMTAPSATTPTDVQHEIEFQLYGALTATTAVLPAMRAAGTGTLFYTTGAGSVDPVTMLGNVNSAAAALRNWAINLNKELAGTGVYAVHIGIDVSINVPAFPGAPTAPAEQIAAAYWDLHTQRAHGEFIYTA